MDNKEVELDRQGRMNKEGLRTGLDKEEKLPREKGTRETNDNQQQEHNKG